MKRLDIDWRLVIGVAAAVGVGAVVSSYRFFRKPPDPDEEERNRRSQLNQVGRIVEGLVVEVVEAPDEHTDKRNSNSKSSHPVPGTNGSRRLVRYSYSISGVSYETAQDVTGLEDRLDLERLAAGQPASVKYDPSNPMNSILIADDWSGVH